MDTFQLEIHLSRHAICMAYERDVDIELIDLCVRTGKLVRIGKNYLKFIKTYENRKIICVAQINQERIKIITVEVGR